MIFENQISEHMWKESVQRVLQALTWRGKFTYTGFRAFGEQILHLRATHARLNGLWWSGQLLYLCETSGQVSAEQSFDIQKMTWLKIWNIYNIDLNWIFTKISLHFIIKRASHKEDFHNNLKLGLCAAFSFPFEKAGKH